MKTYHRSRLEQFHEETEGKQPRRPQFSKELLNQRHIQDCLAKQGKYVEAQSVKQMADKMEQAELQATLATHGAEIQLKLQRLRGQQMQEMEALLQRAARGRDEGRPTFLDIKTYRYRGHSMSDPAKYRSKEEVQAEQAKDPILRLRNWLVAEGIRTDDELDAIDKQAKADSKAAIKFAEDSPYPDPSELTTDVYVHWPWEIE